MVMAGDVSVSPYNCVTVQPSSSSTRSIVDAAGGAPAVSTRTPRGTPARDASGALAIPMRIVGAAHNIVIASRRAASNTALGSTFRKHTWVPPAPVTVHTKVQPFAWNIGSVQR